MRSESQARTHSRHPAVGEPAGVPPYEAIGCFVGDAGLEASPDKCQQEVMSQGPAQSIPRSRTASSKADSVIVEGSVCLIRSEQRSDHSLAESVLVAPTDEDSVNATSSSAMSFTRASALEQKMQKQVEVAKEALQQEASRAAKSNEAHVEERLMSKVQDRMASLEAKVAEIDAIKKEVLSVKQGCETTHSAVMNVQQNIAGIETMVESKVATAAQNLERSMSGKFDDLGEKLMRSLAAMAKKREGDAATAESSDVKMQRGFGGGKRARNPGVVKGGDLNRFLSSSMRSMVEQ